MSTDLVDKTGQDNPRTLAERGLIGGLGYWRGAERIDRAIAFNIREYHRINESLPFGRKRPNEIVSLDYATRGIHCDFVAGVLDDKH